MSTIDERIVSMQFNNREFERNVATTQQSLEGLKKGLNLDAAAKSLDNLDSAGRRFSLQTIGEGVDHIAGKFSALGVIGISVLSGIANKAVTAGTQIVKSLTIGPIGEGFSDYNEKLTSVQTIMNATGASIKTVSGYFNQLDTYADLTIYNLSDMTGAFAKFTNAGLDMDVSVPAIKGIANMVALAGQGAQAASSAMYNLSQSIAGGFLTTTDYKSLNLANVATKEWKEQMIQGAVAAGTLKKGANGAYTIASEKGKGAYTTAQLFNEQLATGWASTKVLTNVLGDYGDETTKIGKKALGAAQDVKSLPMMMDTLKASVGTGWTDSFQILLGDVNQSKELFTGLTDTISGVLQASTDARNGLLKDWAKLGGRTAIIDAVKNSWKALGEIFKPIKEAFQEIFPPATGKQLANISKAIRDFTAGFKMGADTAAQLKSTFKGVFAVFDIGVQVVKGLWTAFSSLFGEATEGSSGILKYTASVGDWLVSIDEAIKKGEGFTNFFKNIGSVLAGAVEALKGFASWVMQALGRGTENAADTADSAVSKLSDRFTPLIDALKNAFSGVINFAKKAWDVVEPIVGAIGEKLGQVGSAIKDQLSKTDFSTILDTINTGLFAGLVLIIKKFTSGGLSGLIQINAGGGFLDSIKSTFGALTDTLKGMQQNLKANILLKIAAAIGIMAASAVALSMIDSAKLTKALAAMSVMFTQLLLAMNVFTKISGAAGVAKMPFVAATLVILAGAILILTSAAKQLAELDWDELARGLTGVAVLLALVTGATKLLSKNMGALVGTGIGLAALAVGIKLLASAVKDFAEMDWETMGRGFAGVAASLTLLVASARVSNKLGFKNAAGLVLLAGALKLIASAVKDFAGMSWAELGTGLAGMAGALVGIGIAMNLMPKNMLVSAAALAVVAGSLMILANVLKQLGGMSMDEITVSMAGLGGSLVIIAAAMMAMSGALPGAAALLVVAGALAILAPVLITLGGISWATLGMGLAALAAALLVFAGLAALLTPVIPVMFALGVAVAALGVGIMAIGVGILAFSTAMTALAALGAAGALAITALVTGIVSLIPIAMAALGRGIVAFADVISKSGPTFVRAMVTLISSLLSAIDKVAPKIAKTLGNLITTLLGILVDNIPKFVRAGYKLLTGILNGIGDNIGGVVKAAGKIIVNFINGLADELPKIIEAGVNLITKFIEGLAKAAVDLANAAGDAIVTFLQGVADAIRTHTGEINAAGGDIADAIIDGMVSGIGGGIGSVVSAAKNMAKSALDAAKGFLGIHSPSKEFKKLGEFSTKGFAQGLTGTKDEVKAAYQLMKGALKDAMASSAEDAKQAKDKLERLTDARKKDNKAIAAAEKALKTANAENKKAKAAYKELTKELDDNQKRLVAKAKRHDQVVQDIKDETKALQDARQAYRDYKASITDQYFDLPDFLNNTKSTKAVDRAQKAYDKVKTKADAAAQALADANQKMSDGAESIRSQYDKLPSLDNTTTLEGYLDQLKSDREALQKFTKDLSTLRSMGLDDETYKQLLEQGPAAQGFIDQLVAGGPSAVAEIDKLNNELNEAAKQLGTTTSQTLYQAGVDAAKANADKIAKDLQAANKALSDASAVTVANYVNSIKAQTKATKKYRDDLKKLLDMGLNQDTYEQLLADGVNSQPFVDALLESGKSGVKEVNDATKGLKSSASTLGTQAAEEMKRAGINTALGLLEGLKAKEKEIQAQMDKMAKNMVKAIKKELGIKSPSRVLAQVGVFTGEGLIKGLKSTTSGVENSSANLGDAAVASLKNSLQNISSVALNDVDMQPTIRPVLDLSDVKKNAGLLPGMLSSPDIRAQSSYNKAATIAIDTRNFAEEIGAHQNVISSAPQISLVQHNTSPKALSTADIYRQTKNQLSQLKGALPR